MSTSCTLLPKESLLQCLFQQSVNEREKKQIQFCRKHNYEPLYLGPVGVIEPFHSLCFAASVFCGAKQAAFTASTKIPLADGAFPFWARVSSRSCVSATSASHCQGKNGVLFDFGFLCREG